MRVLSIVQFYFPFQDRGGPVVKVRSLAESLVKRGHQVTVLTADLGLSGVSGFGAKIERCKWGLRWEDEGVEAVYLPTRGRYRAFTLNPGVVGFCVASLRSFDVVHFYGLYDLLGPAAGYFCRRQGVPYVVEPMGMYRPIDRSLRFKRLWHGTMGKAFLQNAARSDRHVRHRARGTPGRRHPLRKAGDPLQRHRPHLVRPPSAAWNFSVEVENLFRPAFDPFFSAD